MWSLEDLRLKFELNPSVDGNDGFIVEKMAIEGAAYFPQDDKIDLSVELRSNLPTANFRWVHKDSISEEDAEKEIQVPVYMSKARKILLTSVGIPAELKENYVWYQRGVAIFAWDNSN
jgi:hypothetical protein